MTNEQLDELERLEKAATPGPWKMGGKYVSKGPIDPEHEHLLLNNPNHSRYREGKTETTVRSRANQEYRPNSRDEANVRLCNELRNAAPELIRMARLALKIKERVPPGGDEYGYCVGCGEPDGHDDDCWVAEVLGDE